RTWEGEELKLQRVSRDDMSAYLCIARNTVPPQVSKRVVLHVHFHPVIHVPNQLIGSPYGRDVTLECKVEAAPKPVTFWSNKQDSPHTLCLNSLHPRISETHHFSPHHTPTPQTHHLPSPRAFHPILSHPLITSFESLLPHSIPSPKTLSSANLTLSPHLALRVVIQPHPIPSLSRIDPLTSVESDPESSISASPPSPQSNPIPHLSRIRSPHLSRIRFPSSQSNPIPSPQSNPIPSPLISHLSLTQSPHLSRIRSPHLSRIGSPPLSLTRSPHLSLTQSPPLSRIRSPFTSSFKSPPTSSIHSPHTLASPRLTFFPSAGEMLMSTDKYQAERKSNNKPGGYAVPHETHHQGLDSS
ncbi:putative lachesin, partial [Penaeus vannamei]